MAVKTAYISKQGRDYRISKNFKLREFASKDGADKVLYSDDLLSMLEKLRSYIGGTIGINSGYRSPAYNKRIGGASRSKHTQGYAADIVVKKNGKRVSGKLICCLCQTLGFKGVALIKGSGYAVHVDMRPSGIYRGDENHGYSNNVGGDFYRYFGISKSQVTALKSASYKETTTSVKSTIKEWQAAAKADGFTDVGAADGIWGRKSDAVAKKAICYCLTNGNYRNRNLTKIVQKSVGVNADGKFGSGTERAVIAYQKSKGLKADGVVGYNTWKVMLGF